MKEIKLMGQIIKNLNNLLKPKGIRISGGSELREGVFYPQYASVIHGLVRHWNDFSDNEKEEISRTIMKTNKNYLGDFKWVLYQYICDIDSNSDNLINIRCGNFAYNKLAPKMEENRTKIENYCKEHSLINLNGEDVWIHKSRNLDKKQLIISTHDYSSSNYSETETETDTTIYPEDIVLYFA